MGSAQAQILADRLAPEISGQIRLNAEYDFEPSSKSGNSTFKSPGMELNFGIDPTDDIWVQVGLQGGPSRDTENGKWNLQVSTAYAEFLGLMSRRDTLRYGLIPNLWIEYADSIWGYRWNCDTCGVFIDRYKYASRSDLGLSYRSSWTYGFWSLAVTNGEGLDKEEQGGGKDFQMMVEYLPMGLSLSHRMAFALSYIRGNYDHVAAALNKKERFLAQVHYLQKIGLSVILEAFWGEDPVDGINKNVADQVDLTDKGGLIAHSQGQSLLLKYGLPHQMEIFARHNRLNPMQEASARGLNEELLGFGFFPRQNLQFSLAWSQVRYEPDHSSLVGDSQAVSFSTQIGF